eukprot:scaffold1697_cov120-Cylindrotheca_fusiformis.AAC.23
MREVGSSCCVVSDDQAEGEVDVTITPGGMGPTLDDVTIKTWLRTCPRSLNALQTVPRVDGASLGDAMNEAVIDQPDLSFGSLPFVGHPEKTVVTLEGCLCDSAVDETLATRVASRNSGISISEM